MTVLFSTFSVSSSAVSSSALHLHCAQRAALAGDKYTWTLGLKTPPCRFFLIWDTQQNTAECPLPLWSHPAVRALGPSGIAAGSWSGRGGHCDVKGRGFLWLGLRDRRTDWRGVAGKGRGFATLWLLFAVGRSLPGEPEDSGSRLLCFPLGHASTPPPLAEPVLGRCHSRGFRSGAVHPFLPLSRWRAFLVSGRRTEDQARISSSPGFQGAGPVLAVPGTPAARPWEPGLPRLWVWSTRFPGPA